MKVLSWNMLFNNAQSERALVFLRDCGADIICLQEVPDPFLARLCELPYALVYAPETDRVFRGTRSHQNLIILSRYPIKSHTILPLPNRERERDPVRTRLFIGLMYLLCKWARGTGERSALIAEIETPNGRIEVFNLHLPLHRALWRRKEFETIVGKRNPSMPTIVCGDFNTLESRRISILSWLLGGPFADSFFWRRERAHMEERFSAHALTNALRGRVTHPLSQSQLDHILLSRHFTFSEARAADDAVGSDHRPVSALVVLELISRQHDDNEPKRRSQREELIHKR